MSSNQHSFAASLVDVAREGHLDANAIPAAKIIGQIDPTELPFVCVSLTFLAARLAADLSAEDWRALLLEWSGLEDSREVTHGR